GHRLERSRRSAPLQFVDIVEERRVVAERRQSLEEKRELAISAEAFVGKLFDRAVAIDETRRRLCAAARDAWIAVRGIADEREVVGDSRGDDAELLAYAVRISNGAAAAIDLHPPIPDD